MNLKQHEWFPKLQKNTIGTWKKQCFLELTWNLKKHDFQNLDDIRSATRAGHCNRVALAAVDSVAFGLRVISLARKRPPPGSDRNRHWTFFRSNCKITGGIEVSPLRNEYWMYCMSHVWEWIISEFEQIVPRRWVGTASKQSNNRNVDPLKRAQAWHQLQRKAHQGLGKTVVQQILAAKKLPQLYTSIHHRKIFGFSACNQLSSTFNLETLDINVTLKTF